MPGRRPAWPFAQHQPRNTRRIDFALVHRSLFATGGNTVRREDFSDHGIVSYELGLQIHPCAYHCPRFLELTAADPATIADALTAELSGMKAALRRFSAMVPLMMLKSQPPNHRCGPPEGHQSETLRALGRRKSRLRRNSGTSLLLS